MQVFLKLRNNIVLDSDLQLAEREISNMFEQFILITKDNIHDVTFMDPINVLSNTRQGEIIGYLADGLKIGFQRIIQLLSFIQECWVDKVLKWDNGCSIVVGNVTCFIPFMAMSEFLFYSKKITIKTPNQIVYALGKDDMSDKNVAQSIQRVKTSSPHVHSFHTYKAKFFPRFVRSLIVGSLDLSRQTATILDPFVGSGTTLVECALMGYNSIGTDIDALSCLIAKTKCDALHLDELTEQGFFRKGSVKDTDLVFSFPEIMAKKFVRKGTVPEMKQYEAEITNLITSVADEEPYRSINRVAISDALTRKFNVRMMGTGSGRFALEIGKTDLHSIVKSDIKNAIKSIQTIDILKRIYNLSLSDAVVHCADATNRTSIANDSIDIIVTSPPYVPASSGREDYLVGKIISLKAMGLYNNDNIDQYNQKSVGAMSNKSTDVGSLPESVKHLYNWLINDELRSVKAEPIVAYYNSIKSSLLEDKRTIKKGGKIIYIIGKDSVFYSSETKEVLYRIECEQIFKEIASSIGLNVLETIRVELDKKDNIARPRGTDKYYESAIIMEKN